jgi:DNA polymerase-3 subunit beta
MEIAVKNDALKEELSFVQGIVEKKTTIPILSNLLIESVGENLVSIVATDLDVTIRCEIAAEVYQPGAICIKAQKFFDIARLLPDSAVRLRKIENDWVRLSCSNSRFKLAGVSPDQYPEIPKFNSASFSLPVDLLSSFIRNTSFATTSEQSRFTLSGARFAVSDGRARMVTTDGHRLAFIEHRLSNHAGDSFDALIPRKAIRELGRILRSSSGELIIGEDSNHLFFDLGSRLLITRRLSGTFPNYDMVIPRDNDKTAIFDLESLKNAVARVALMADEGTNSILLSIRDGEAKLGAQSSELGEAFETLSADYAGDAVEVGFNSRYLSEYLNNIDAETLGLGEADDAEGSERKTNETSGSDLRISFDFKDANTQTKLEIDGETDYDYKYIVMPLRI